MQFELVNYFVLSIMARRPPSRVLTIGRLADERRSTQPGLLTVFHRGDEVILLQTQHRLLKHQKVIYCEQNTIAIKKTKE